MLNGKDDAFVARLYGTTGGTSWSTYYGGSASDVGYSIVVDQALNAYVGGKTNSFDLPATPGAHDATYAGMSGNADGFLAKFSNTGTLKAATYFGNGQSDEVVDLTLDASNRLDLLGRMHRDVFSPGPAPATPGAFDVTLDGDTDALVAKFDSSLGLTWATYYGGSKDEMAYANLGSIGSGGIAIGKDNHIHVGGSTYSDLMATPGSHKTVRQNQDAFLAEFVE